MPKFKSLSPTSKCITSPNRPGREQEFMCDFKGGKQKRVKVLKYDIKGLVKSVGQHEHHVSQIMKLSEGFVSSVA